ncbi:MAG TPA: tetratricopeptide repeat protein, partial [Thermoanaerobaculia bacterium]|nr:tetratricopeptide repeat protein [Thermoanaerobaculia bacterium]
FLRRDEEIRYRFTRDAEGRDQVAIVPSYGETLIARRVSESVRVPADELEKGRFAEAVAGYRRLHDANPSDPSVAEARLNGIGYAFLTHGEKKGAIALFRLNTELYPGSANTYDSLAEAHMMAGDRKQAIALYRKALETLPRDKSSEETKESVRASATAKLKELEEKE